MSRIAPASLRLVLHDNGVNYFVAPDVAARSGAAHSNNKFAELPITRGSSMKTFIRESATAFSVASFIISLTLLGTPASWAQQKGQSLVGTYKLASVQREIDGKLDAAAKGSKGYLIITPKAYALIITDGARKYGTSASEKAALWDSLTAHAGAYRIEGSKIIMLPDAHSNESFVSTQQPRDWQIKGNRLLLTSEPRPYGRDPSKKIVAHQEWEKID
jgi:hypothetical protein